MNIKHLFKLNTVSLLIALQLLPQASFATNFATKPLVPSASIAPNIIFGMDDSGSMDFEVLFNAADGSAWYTANLPTNPPPNESFFNVDGSPRSNPVNGNTNTGAGVYKYVYLYPMGSNGGATSGVNKLLDPNGNDDEHIPIPPTPEFAAFRSPDFNPLYYDDTKTYDAWDEAYIASPATISAGGSTSLSGNMISFTNSSTTAARAHPLYQSTATMNLTTTISITTQKTYGWSFRIVPGMTIPAGSQVANTQGGTWTNVTADTKVTGTMANPKVDPDNNGATNNTVTARWLATPYNPAQYWRLGACTINGTTCVAAPNGGTLKLTTVSNMQNFANWFTYHRKRKLMLAAAMGKTLTPLKDVRVGLVKFNDLSSVSMLDFNSVTPASNAKAMIGLFHQNPSNGGTPTRNTLDYIGKQFMNNTSIIQYECQRNNAFIVTDGFPNLTTITVPSYDRTTWGPANENATGTIIGATPGATLPYAPHFTSGTNLVGTLEDLALYYYTVQLKSLTADKLNKVPITLTPDLRNNDLNSNLHMNTYAITLGAKGDKFNGGNQNPFTSIPAWVAPDVNYAKSSLDDLWHATINGRGKMFTADNATSLSQSLSAAIAVMISKIGGQSANMYTSSRFTNNTKKLVASYQPIGWSSTLNAFKINPSTGITIGSSLWEANSLLTAQPYINRYIATFNGTSAVPFSASDSSITSAINPSNLYASNHADLVNYLRGDRTKEQTITTPANPFRERSSGILGSIINAKPTPGNPDTLGEATMLYQAANDGMLHAFDMATGNEKWAYIPKGALKDLGKYAQPLYQHQMFLDQAPIYYEFSSKKVLVGGLGAGGKGYYALDVTNPNASSDNDVASKVLWELPNASMGSEENNVGYAMHPPQILQRKVSNDWVVIATNGYNASLSGGSGDGKGKLYVINPLTGAIIHTISTGVGTPSTPAHLGGVTPMYDANSDKAQYAYAGDELGNMWRFDLEAGTVVKLAEATDSSSAAQPIVAPPSVGTINTTYGTKQMVAFGTGRLFSPSDYPDTQFHSMYFIEDTMVGTPPVVTRTNLTSMSTNGGNAAMDWSTGKRGWFMDFPIAGEKANYQVAFVAKTIIFVTNKVDSVNLCNSRSYIYLVKEDATTAPSTWFGTMDPFLRMKISDGLATGPVISKTISGRPQVTIRIPSGLNTNKDDGSSSSITNSSTFGGQHDTTANDLNIAGPGATRGNPRRTAWIER